MKGCNLPEIVVFYFYREKILRLEHENKMLKLRSNSTDGGDNDQVLQSMLDDTNSRKNELETELRSVITL